MISHFLGVSQTLILKGGHTGSTFSKILGNSHWGGGGVSHTWAIRVCAKLCSLRRFITEPGKRGAFPFWQLLSGTGSQIQFAWKKFRVSKTRHTTPTEYHQVCHNTETRWLLQTGKYIIYLYPEGHHSHITTKSARPGLPLKQEQNS